MALIPSPCEAIAANVGALFQCTDFNEHVRIRTPFLYPDGDVIDLFVREREGMLLVSDLGESLRWLKSQTTTARRSNKQRRMIDDVCMTLGVELYKGMLMIRAKEPALLAEAVTRLGQAAVRVSDVWLTFRNRAIETVTDEIADFMTEKQIGFERGEKRPGRSGRMWTVDFHTVTPARSTLLSVLASGSHAAARGVAEHVVAQWHDLSHVQSEGIRLVSLFDDTLDVWTPEDFKLVGSVSDVARWSRPDQVEDLLKAA